MSPNLYPLHFWNVTDQVKLRASPLVGNWLQTSLLPFPFHRGVTAGPRCWVISEWHGEPHCTFWCERGRRWGVLALIPSLHNCTILFQAELRKKLCGDNSAGFCMEQLWGTGSCRATLGNRKDAVPSILALRVLWPELMLPPTPESARSCMWIQVRSWTLTWNL